MVSGKEFRNNLKKPLAGAGRSKSGRLVPAFTIQALQRGTTVIPPPKCNAFKEIPPKPTKFRQNYLRGNLPIAMESKGGKVSWKVRVFNV